MWFGGTCHFAQGKHQSVIFSDPSPCHPAEILCLPFSRRTSPWGGEQRATMSLGSLSCPHHPSPNNRLLWSGTDSCVAPWDAILVCKCGV